MAKKYNGTINFASALRPTGAQPLDDRMVVQSLTDLMSVATFEANGASAAYNGMMVAVLEEQKVFMLIDAANLTEEKSWISVGSGNGSLSVNTLDEAKSLATVDNRGQIIFVIEQNATYVVTGAATVMKLAASTADSIDELVAALQSDINTLKGIVGAPASGETEATGLVKEVAELKAEVEAIEIPDVPVQNVTVNGASVLGEDGVAAIELPDFGTFETVEDADKVRERMGAAESAIEGLDAAVKAIVIPDVPVQDVTVNGTSVLGENGVAAIELPDFGTFEKVADANAVRERMGAAEGAITALQTKDGELATAIDGKVAKEEGKRLMTNDEGTKLEGIEEGAQVNKIEVVKVNGQALSISAGDKSVDVTVPAAPVQGVAAEEKVLSLDGDKLKTTLTLAYVPATKTENAVLRLQGINGAVVSSIDATAFVKDGMLAGASLEGPKEGETGERYLSLTFHVGEGTEEIRMDVSELIDYYAAGDGLALSGKTFAIKLDATAESYLKVTTNGLAVADALWTKVDEKDTAVLTSAQGYADTKKTEAISAATGYTDTAIANLELDKNYEKAGVAQGLIDGLKLAETYEAKGAADDALSAATAYTDTAIANLELDKNYEKAGVAQGLIDGLKLAETYEKVGVAAGLLEDHEKAMETVLAGKANVGDSYTKTDSDTKYVAKVEGERLMTDAEGTKLEGIEEGAQVNAIETITVNGIAATIDDEKDASVKIDAKDIELGVDITGTEGATIYSGDTKISTVLQGIQDSIRAAVAGGVNSVTSADAVIEVNNADPNNPKVSLKVETASETTVAAGHIEMVKGENGIYGMMYYDGDDAE